MSRFPFVLGLLACLLPAVTKSQPYELVWQDEFDGTQLDLTKWQPQIGTGCPALCGWGNNELQYYRSQNATVSGGFLTITAKQESFGGSSYTSARLRTLNRGDWTYGRFEMRAKMPIGRGLWPAFWMLSSDEEYGTWAASGEIDIFEYLGHRPNEVLGTLHYGGGFPDNVYSSRTYRLSSGTFHDDFHVFALEWDPYEMRWLVDGKVYATQINWYTTAAPYPAPFDRRFHLLLNLAVGGNLPGPPDATTVFPQQLVVDYVRVYQLPAYARCLVEFDGMEHAAPFANGWFSFGGSVGGGGIGANLVDLPPVDGRRVSLESGWGSGGVPGFFGGFGRNRPLDLTGLTHFTFWILPDAQQDYTLEINLQEDDAGDDVVAATPDGTDDEFQYNFRVSPSGPDAISGGGWQRVAIPLTSFVDDNSYHYGGNGIFDPFPVSAGGNGRLVNVVFAVLSTQGAPVTFRTDRWAFTRQTSSIGGTLWSDTDGDGVRDALEPGIAGAMVELIDERWGQAIASRSTASDGGYLFDTLFSGPCRVRIDPQSLPSGHVPTFDPDGTGSANAFALVLDCDQAMTDGDFGYAPPSSWAPAPTHPTTALHQNVPNPFNPSTVITFELAEPGRVELVVYDAAGRMVRSLVRADWPAGSHWVQWDGRDERGRPVASGSYHYTLRTSQGIWTRRMALLR
jgi:beta-glucanase (GH16 family)